MPYLKSPQSQESGPNNVSPQALCMCGPPCRWPGDHNCQDPMWCLSWLCGVMTPDSTGPENGQDMLASRRLQPEIQIVCLGDVFMLVGARLGSSCINHSWRMLMVLPGPAVPSNRQRLDSDPTGTECKQHMQSEVDSLVERAELARYASSCFMMQVILFFLQTSGSRRSAACQLYRCDGPVVGKTANPTIRVVAPPAAIKFGSVNV